MKNIIFPEITFYLFHVLKFYDMILVLSAIILGVSLNFINARRGPRRISEKNKLAPSRLTVKYETVRITTGLSLGSGRCVFV